MKEQDLVSAIKEHDWKQSWLDFSVFLYDRERLIIVGSNDLSYYHTLEIIIESPSFVQGILDWPCDVNHDFIKISKDNLEDEFIINFHSDDEFTFKAIGKHISINFDTVFYYKREDLKPGERLAYFVK
ncbi:hypothetical protein EXT68_17095 [Pectobacterium parmentieri]|uniref:Uncharacterized protein n=1 Tax=Pectobacterium parmentieri TaxID=1905730 RepID=A0A0H3IBP9_PECPM|nr:hypothetical protein [Pectobacterium parmentieri]AFI92510.1 Hypothetical protein W5S_4464 [Pectobacterium parmentieri]MBI0473096.1 hypothetical protein [Pectobacterium parmentieri]MBI0495709.1 hypothetical protein [Pectobacterium parmentieri]MBI0557118.1 hypothetical protein [Pectobacterium parmentieri]MBI0570261.1 hypothetical protein [Pectobacterium parmentieri]